MALKYSPFRYHEWAHYYQCTISTRTAACFPVWLTERTLYPLTFKIGLGLEELSGSATVHICRNDSKVEEFDCELGRSGTEVREVNATPFWLTTRFLLPSFTIWNQMARDQDNRNNSFSIGPFEAFFSSLAGLKELFPLSFHASRVDRTFGARIGENTVFMREHKLIGQNCCIKQFRDFLLV